MSALTSNASPSPASGGNSPFKLQPAQPSIAAIPPGAWDLHGRRAYLIGIGGCGMSGLARMIHGRGAQVSGSDMHPSETTAALLGRGIQVDFDQSRAWLPDATDLVVCSAAIKPDHPQLLEAQRRGIEVFTYAEALGMCMLGRTAVCIAGTHGKSTTTAMLSCILSDAGLDPTAIVGATCAQLAGASGLGGGGFRLGGATIPAGTMAGAPGLLLAESCEFNRSFHNYHPTLAAITSVEADHLDIYGSLDAVVEAFREFARRIAPASQGGLLLIAHDGAHRREVCAGVRCAVQTIGFSPEADWVVTHEPASRTTTLRGPEGEVMTWQTNMPGAHNAMNAATAAALALSLGADPARLAPSLSAFRGVDRRTQFLGERTHPRGGGAVRVYDDYGHHPTEIESTLRALRQFEAPEARGGRLICVFQPHQHSRTRHLLEEFTSAFSAADMVIVPDIYFVRDSIAEKQKISSRDLVDRLRAKGVTAMHMHPFEAIVEQLDNLTRPGDLLVVMGAGPVFEVAQGFLQREDSLEEITKG